MTIPSESPAAENEPAEHAKRPSFRIQIDRHHYDVDKHRMTGSELRHLPEHTIPESRDLYEIRHDGRDDELISLTDEVHIRDGLRFFTAPGRINPGQK